MTSLGPDVVGIPDIGPPRVGIVGVDDDWIMTMTEGVRWCGRGWFCGIEVSEGETAPRRGEPSFPVDETIYFGVDTPMLESGKEACRTLSFLVKNDFGIINGMAGITE